MAQAISKMETTQTAVEWLVMTYHQRQGYIRFEDIEQAKAMEKEQIVAARMNGMTDNELSYLNAEEYYNETYNK